MKTFKYFLCFVFFLSLISLISPSAHASAKMDANISRASASSNSQHDRLKPKSSAHKRKFKKDENINSEAGLNIPEWGVAIDAFYDSRLTNLLPGYHIVNIVVTNRRNSQILLDPLQDRWTIVDNAGKKHLARNHASQLKGNVWEQLPQELKVKLDYPTSIKPGNFVTLDVFLPDNIELTNFREVVWKSHFLNKEFNIFTNYEDNVSLGSLNSDKQHPIPQTQIQPYSSDEDTKTREEILNPTAPNKWDNQDKEAEDRESSGFDPSFDDAIIIR